MTLDHVAVHDLARSYADAWCSHDPANVAEHYVPGGTIAINGGEPAEITEVARGFFAAFPDIEVFVDNVVVKSDTGESRRFSTTMTVQPVRIEVDFSKP